MSESRFSWRLAAQILLPVVVLVTVFVLWGRGMWFAAAPFVVSLVLAYILYPVVVLLQRRVCRGRRFAAVALLYVLIVLVVVPVVTILVVGVAGELIDLYGKLPQYWENLKGIGQTLTKHLPPLPEEFRERIRSVRDEWDAVIRDPERLRELWEQRIAPLLAPEAAAKGQTPSVSDVAREISTTGVGKSVGKGVGDVVSGLAAALQFVLRTMLAWTGGVISLVTTTVFVTIILFYLLLDYEKLGAAIPRFIPPAIRDDFLRVWGAIDRQLSGFLRGQITVAICVGILSAILYTIVGVDSGILIGLFAGVCNIIPYLGSVMGFLPALVSSIIEQYANGWGAIMWQLLWVCVVFGVIQFLEGFFIAPRVMSDAVDLHPGSHTGVVSEAHGSLGDPSAPAVGLAGNHTNPPTLNRWCNYPRDAAA
jgi:predicted PurR-regulated permease PerM